MQRSVLAAASSRFMQSAAAAPSAALPASALSRSLPSAAALLSARARSSLHLTPARSIATDKQGGMRSRKQAQEDGEDDADSGKTSEEKRAAREAKKARRAAAAEEAKEAETQARRERRVAEKAASTRAAKRGVSGVIEKEVPLMDLSGLQPGQNRFASVLNVLRENNFPQHVIEDIEAVGDYATGSTAEILSGKLANLREKYGRKPHDTGSPEVQIAMLTERLKGYDRHMTHHRSDVAARKGFLAVWHRRRKLLKYLRRTKYETYAFMMKELNLKEADIDNYGLDRTSGTQAARIKRD